MRSAFCRGVRFNPRNSLVPRVLSDLCDSTVTKSKVKRRCVTIQRTALEETYMLYPSTHTLFTSKEGKNDRRFHDALF